MDKTLLVPLDNNEVSEKMIREADAWAAQLGSMVSFLHGINPNYSWGEEKKPLFEERFEKAIHSCEVKSKYEVLFRVGKPYPKILEMEEELNPMMILMAALSLPFLPQRKKALSRGLFRSSQKARESSPLEGMCITS